MVFFWSFMVLVFMILLKFLLAIIVDAFSEVKERTKETTGKQDGNLYSVPPRCWKEQLNQEKPDGTGLGVHVYNCMPCLYKQWPTGGTCV